jgi:aminoglycoside phosphotransferase (APT) family kinase protein
MTAGKMHPDELDTDADLVRRLLRSQFPQWADLPIEPVQSAGTDNALYRLGDGLVARLPRIHWAVDQVEKERQWLPRLASRLPLAIPVPLAAGAPGEGYPWHWSICPWLEGDNAVIERIADLKQAALDLAQFISALQQIETVGGPTPGQDGIPRGIPLARRDAHTRSAIVALKGLFDVDATTAVWDAALHAPVWSASPVWIHGDLQSGNLLAVGGRLHAVIDFGCLGIGDPAYDVMAAWMYLPADVRGVFRAALQVDDHTWARARGLALSVGLIALPYYQDTNPVLADIARRAIEAALADDSGPPATRAAF